ncbi:MAG: bacterial Ig-like domain-containing protein, partial [Lachnospiraceae bacterium]
MQNPGKRKLSLLAVLFVVAVMLFGFREKEADAAEKRLSSVTAVYTGDTVLVGHSIDLSKLTVMGLYTDGSYVKVKDYSLSTYVVTKAGSNQITLTSDGVSTSFSVNGKKILFLTASYSKSSVTVGEELKRDEITVYAYYSDGTNEKVTDYILSHTLVSLVGTNQFTIIY